MKCVILLNGEGVDKYKVDNDAFVIAADGALNYALNHNIAVNKSVGDFDSLGYIPNNATAYPSEKDFTDGEIALQYAKSLNFSNVDFVCAGGLREDHFLCNLALLEQADNIGIVARAVTNFSTIYFVKDNIKLTVLPNTIISVIAITDSIISSSTGLKYAYNNTTLKRSSTLGISNIAIENEISLTVKSGLLYVVVNNN